ncbi:phospholipid carrier-dependent glycosyltransferase [Lyngbya sp. CCY1209]|uniref:dolichyl-phosphate-mannose--protein mannosyltransferase n=1 Tax=Lyngbya sp. CCY1209 TaxID=2886103 RepID=UPI002D20A272|nr:phospholipid carrier-dependent glycosyltransferase [Lyngbya sp. CCY1209]MEB3884815.1 phospholipid carrier-dependent glycosyltransferase [Lyngbya sp. CCY1209]
MQLLTRFSRKFWVGMTAIFLLSLSLRFWDLDRFNTLVFDEVYFAKFAHNYLTRTPFFNSHPPLSQYLIAIALQIGSIFNWGSDAVHDAAGYPLSPWNYRWMNAAIGSTIPVLVGAIAYQLTRRSSFAFIAAGFMALDGLFLVESRYALNNIYIIFFGLLAQLLFLISLSCKNQHRPVWLILAGVCFGASVAVKWNGLGFLLGIYLLLIVAGLMKWRSPAFSSPLERLTELKPIHIILNLAIVPFLTYTLLWIPHLRQNPKYNLWELHQKILTFHQNLGGDTDIHPYCSQWHTWPGTIRPMVYFFERVNSPENIPPSLNNISIPEFPIIYDVHGMGNPVLWWFSILAIAGFVGVALSDLVSRDRILPKPEYWVILYAIANWGANFLPWAMVSRCLFIYHYMGAVVFAIMAAAWWCDRWLHSRQPDRKIMGMTAIVLVVMAFLYWLPIYLGLPLSPEEWKLRMWLNSWI